jgi:hypothetical protein
MGDLSEVQQLVAREKKAEAISLLASSLLKNKDQVDAWFLLGELVEDPLRRKFCYQQVLRLAPWHAQVSARLQALEHPVTGEVQTANAEESRLDNKATPNATRRQPDDVRSQLPYTIHDSSEDKEVIAYVIAGIVAFLIFLYAILSMDIAAGDNTVVYVGLFLLMLIAGLIITSAGNKHRD